MRSLRLVGLHEDGSSIVCEDPARRERFLLAADERLRAAIRGDITRLGQIEIELESQMRPREIQARIRAGESVEQVASAAGVSQQRVERFAYPVLLERSRTAELAQQAHPVRDDGPDVQTLGEVVAYAFGVRGHDYSHATWDAWRGDDGKWVVGLEWEAGRSTNRARWAFSPGAHGGTVTALDELAEALLDPDSFRAPRAVAPSILPVLQPDDVPQPPRDQRGGILGPPVRRDPDEDDTKEIPRIPAEEPAPARREEPSPRRQADTGTTGAAKPATTSIITRKTAPAAEPRGYPDSATAKADDANADGTKKQEPKPDPKPAANTRQPKKPTKRERAAIPAWEDVLLGVRTGR